MNELKFAETLQRLLRLDEEITVVPIDESDFDKCIAKFPVYGGYGILNRFRPGKIRIYGIGYRHSNGVIERYNLLVRIWLSQEQKHVYKIYYFGINHDYIVSVDYGNWPLLDDNDIPYKEYNVSYHGDFIVSLSKEVIGLYTKATR